MQNIYFGIHIKIYVSFIIIPYFVWVYPNKIHCDSNVTKYVDI